MLKVDNVTKYYGDFRAVHNLSFEVNKGEIFGLLGVNGAGKTTTFRMILGLLDKSAGTITLNDKEIDYDLTDKIGFLTEERSLLTKLTVKEQVLYYATLKDDVSDVERKLKKKIDRDMWIQMHHSMIFFGRYFCKAISPRCDECKLKGKCRVNYK